MNFSLIEIAAYISILILTISLFLAFLRLVKGPWVPDRVVALDLIAIFSIGFIVSYTIISRQTVYFVAALVLALVSFLGTVAFARFLERRALHD